MYRTTSFPTIWNEFLRLQRDMDKLLGDSYQSSKRIAPQYPAINVWANQDSAMITAELPGLNKKDIEINVIGDTVSIKGSREPEELPKNAKYQRQEIGYGNFHRSLQFPYTIDANKVEATFKIGILTVKLPRIEAEKPKKIVVKTL